MKKWQSFLAVCVIFVLGMAAGALVTIGIGHNIVQRLIRGGPQAINHAIVQRVSHELHLNDAQREQARTIIAEAHQKIRLARKQIDPQIDDALKSAETELRKALESDQQKKFDAMVAKEHERLKRFN